MFLSTNTSIYVQPQFASVLLHPPQVHQFKRIGVPAARRLARTRPRPLVDEGVKWSGREVANKKRVGLYTKRTHAHTRTLAHSHT
jgi:hypothetical protein